MWIICCCSRCLCIVEMCYCHNSVALRCVLECSLLCRLSSILTRLKKWKNPFRWLLRSMEDCCSVVSAYVKKWIHFVILFGFSLQNLTHLNLAGNEISKLSQRVFYMLTNLEHLDLSHNPMVDLLPSAFKDIMVCMKCAGNETFDHILHAIWRNNVDRNWIFDFCRVWRNSVAVDATFNLSIRKYFSIYWACNGWISGITR